MRKQCFWTALLIPNHVASSVSWVCFDLTHPPCRLELVSFVSCIQQKVRKRQAVLSVSSSKSERGRQCYLYPAASQTEADCVTWRQQCSSVFNVTPLYWPVSLWSATQGAERHWLVQANVLLSLGLLRAQKKKVLPCQTGWLSLPHVHWLVSWLRL